MIQKKHTFLQSMFGNQLNFHEKLIRMILMLEILASVIGMGRVLIGAGALVLIALVPRCMIAALALWITIKYEKPKLVSFCYLREKNFSQPFFFQRFLFLLLIVYATSIRKSCRRWRIVFTVLEIPILHFLL